MLSLRTGCPWRELPAIYGNPNTLMSRYNRWKQDGTIDRITAALGFTPPTDYERHNARATGPTNARSSSAMASTLGYLTVTTIPISASLRRRGGPTSVRADAIPLALSPRSSNFTSLAIKRRPS